MFFTYTSRILSVILFLFGATKFLMGFAIALGWIDLPYDVALARYLPGSKTTGEAIDKGSLYILSAAALGTLSEMSFALRSMRGKL